MFTSTVSTIGSLVALVIPSLSNVASDSPLFKGIANPGSLGIGLSDWIIRFKQTTPDSWSSTHFDPSRWDHYALIVVLLGVSSWGLWLSWSWNQEKR